MLPHSQALHLTSPLKDPPQLLSLSRYLIHSPSSAASPLSGPPQLLPHFKIPLNCSPSAATSPAAYPQLLYLTRSLSSAAPSPAACLQLLPRLQPLLSCYQHASPPLLLPHTLPLFSCYLNRSLSSAAPSSFFFCNYRQFLSISLMLINFSTFQWLPPLIFKTLVFLIYCFLVHVTGLRRLHYMVAWMMLTRSGWKLDCSWFVVYSDFWVKVSRGIIQCSPSGLEPTSRTSEALMAQYLNVRQRKLGTIIIQTVHILQHDSAVTGSLPKGDILHGNPTYFQITLPGSSTVTSLYQ
jgi:hypothetical protein